MMEERGPSPTELFGSIVGSMTSFIVNSPFTILRLVLAQALIHLQEMDLCSFLNVFMYLFLYFSSFAFYSNIFPQTFAFPNYPFTVLV